MLCLVSAWPNHESSLTMAYAPIVLLFFPRRPFAIGGEIASIIVDAFDSVLWCWLAAHVGEEVLIACSPALADRDASATVVFPLAKIGVGASLDHSVPGAILAGMVFSFAMFERFYAMYFISKTSARRKVFVQVVSSKNAFFAAVASTSPIIAIVASVVSREFLAAVIRDDSQAAKSTACYISHGHRSLPMVAESSSGQALARLTAALL
jgi:hypothetical protein